MNKTNNPQTVNSKQARFNVELYQESQCFFSGLYQLSNQVINNIKKNIGISNVILTKDMEKQASSIIADSEKKYHDLESLNKLLFQGDVCGRENQLRENQFLQEVQDIAKEIISTAKEIQEVVSDGKEGLFLDLIKRIKDIDNHTKHSLKESEKELIKNSKIMTTTRDSQF